jgi:hypothetical protein
MGSRISRGKKAISKQGERQAYRFVLMALEGIRGWQRTGIPECLCTSGVAELPRRQWNYPLG